MCRRIDKIPKDSKACSHIISFVQIHRNGKTTEWQNFEFNQINVVEMVFHRRHKWSTWNERSLQRDTIAEC